MLPIEIDPKRCKRCKPAWCVDDCPADCLAVSGKSRIPVVLYPDECTHCGNCRISCPNGAIKIIFPLAMII